MNFDIDQSKLDELSMYWKEFQGFGSTSNGLIIVNETLDIVYTNEAFAQLAGKGREVLIGQKVARLIIRDTHLKVETRSLPNVNRIAMRYAGKVRSEYGELISVACTIIPLETSGNPKGQVIVVSNLEDESESLSNVLAFQYRDTLLADLISSNFHPKSIDVEYPELVSFLDTYCGFDQGFVTDLVAIRSADSSDASKPFSMREVLQNILEELQPKLLECNIKLKVTGLSTFKNKIMGDPLTYELLFSDVFNCILYNGERGTVVLNFSSVESEGVSFKFGAHFELDKKLTQSTRLLSCLEKIETEFDVEKNWDGSSTLNMYFSARKAQDKKSLDSVHGLSKSLQGFHIMVVDDNNINLTLAQRLLKDWGARVTLVHNGVDSISGIEESRPDLVLMDVHMPVMDGLEATRLIRSEEKLTGRKRLPIIAVTAATMEAEKKACFDAGMDDYIPKPLDMAILHRSISDLLGIKNNNMRLMKSEDVGGVIVSEDLSINLDKLNAMFEGDPDFVRDMLATFRQDLPIYVDEIQDLAQKRLWTQIPRVAHKAKSIVGYLGCDVLQRSIEWLERNPASLSSEEEVRRRIQQLLAQVDEVMDNLNKAVA